MPSDISRFGSSGAGALSPQGARRVRRSEEELAIRTQLANETDIAQNLLARASVQRYVGLARVVRQALDEDPLNVGALSILEAYAEGAQDRVRSLGRF